MSDLERIIGVAASQQRQIELLRALLASLNPPERVLEQLDTLDAIQALAGEHISESDLCDLPGVPTARETLTLHPQASEDYRRTTAFSEHLIVSCIEVEPLTVTLWHDHTVIANGSGCLRMFVWVKPHQTLQVVGTNLTGAPVRVQWPPRIMGFRLLG